MMADMSEPVAQAYPPNSSVTRMDRDPPSKALVVAENRPPPAEPFGRPIVVPKLVAEHRCPLIFHLDRATVESVGSKQRRFR